MTQSGFALLFTVVAFSLAIERECEQDVDEEGIRVPWNVDAE